jgi:membrane-bound metal-dependent hydrolase YbcI (DUF457 family)
MTGRTHDLAAFSALSFIALSQPLVPITLGTAGLAVFANLLGGIAPDIDEPTAPLWRNLPVGSVFGKVVHRLLGGHRFLSHSLLGLLIFGVGWYMLLAFLHPSMPNIAIEPVWWAFMIGVLSHLLADSLTEEGVPWLLPLPYKFGFPPIKRLRIVTGGWFEAGVVFPGLLLADFWLYWSHYQEILTYFHHTIH